MFSAQFQTQKDFFASGITRSYEWRKTALLKLKNSILQYENEILDALEKDLCKHPTEGYMSEILQVLQEIQHTLKILKHYTKPKKVVTPPTLFMGKSQIHYDPYGIVLIISAWNYPFSLLLNPLVGAIAGGNCAFLKPSEYTPHTQNVIEKIIQNTFSSSFCTLIKGGAEITQALLQQRFDYVFFTGSPQVGKIIASACAKELIPFTLELGGKNPCIVDESADLTLTAKRIVWGKFLNAGQTCIAPDFLLVQQSIKEKLISLLLEEIKESFGNDPLSQFGQIISPRHFQRALSLLEFNPSLGAIYGGKSQAQKIEPTLIDFGTLNNHPALCTKLMQEEIFAPILPIFGFETLQECIQFIQSREKPLATYLFSQNKNHQQQILNLPFGGGCINDCIMQVSNPNLPFGGVGQSGIGHYHGKFGIETFCHQKSIYIAPKFEFPIRYPPYDKLFLGISKFKWLKLFS